MMTEELLKALQLIKEECEKHPDFAGCENCPMHTTYGDCGVTENCPRHWKLEKREVYF